MSRTVGSFGPKTLEAIRHAGLRLIVDHGYEAMSLRQLAAAVGLQPGSLYNHISTKQALLMDLVTAHMDQLLGHLDAALEGITGPQARLEAFLAFHVDYHMTRQAEVFVINFELRSLEPENYDKVVAMRRSYEQRLIAILEEGVRQGLFVIQDVPVAAYGIIALLTGVCTWYRPDGRLGASEIIATYTKLVLHGVQGAKP